MHARFARKYTKSTPADGDVTLWQPERWPITTPQATTADMSYFDGYGARNRGPAYRLQARPLRLNLRTFLFAVLSLATYFGAGTRPTLAIPPTPSAVLAGVNVCAVADVNYSLQGCTAIDTVAAAGSGSSVCYRAPAGRTFTGTEVAFAVQRIDANGRILARGRSSDEVTNAQSSWCTAIDTVIHNAQLPLTPGSYSVAVHNGSADLGSTTFTLTAPTT